MNNVQVFHNQEFGDLEVLIIDGKEYFPATECARILGYAKPHGAISKHCAHSLKRGGVSFTENQYGARTEQTVVKNYIPEGDLYRLIVRSKLPSAEKFEKWVFDEVLPSIRKHGAYIEPEKLAEIMSDPDSWIKMLTTIRDERAAKEQLQLEVEKNAPKVLFADAVSGGDGTVSVADLAKILKVNGMEVGQNRLYEILRQKGFLIKQHGTGYNTPTQKSISLGLFRIKESVVNLSDGQTLINKTARVTGKGQRYFVDMFLNEQKEKDDAKSSVVMVDSSGHSSEWRDSENFPPYITMDDLIEADKLMAERTSKGKVYHA
jgi:anti-repressor protein